MLVCNKAPLKVYPLPTPPGVSHVKIYAVGVGLDTIGKCLGVDPDRFTNTYNHRFTHW